MKKLSILSAVLGMAVFGAASAADIAIYHSPTCPHCHHARDFIEGQLVYEYPTLSVSEINLMVPENVEKFQDALAKCEYDSGGVPVIVIGDKCFQGYADFMQQDLRNAVEADMSDADKATAAENRKAYEQDAEGFKAAHADRANAISEYSATAASDETAQKKNDVKHGTTAYFYGLLIVLVAALGFVLIRKKK